MHYFTGKVNLVFFHLNPEILVKLFTGRPYFTGKVNLKFFHLSP